MSATEYKASNGAVYRVTGTPEQQRAMQTWIEERVAAGDPDLKGSKPPMNAQIGTYELPPEEQPAPIMSFLRGGTRGLLSNFADEITAYGNAAIPGMAALDNMFGGAGDQRSTWGSDEDFMDTVQHNLESMRHVYAQDEQYNPTATGIGRLTGEVEQALIGGKLAGKALEAAPAAMQKLTIPALARLEAARMASPLKTAAAEGAAAGTAMGSAAGAGEGENASERVDNAVTGGAGGGLGGAVLSPAISVIGPAVRRYASVLFGRHPDQEAMRQLVEALNRDGYDVSSPTGVKALKDELSSYLGKPVSLADIGNATRARAGVGLRTPSDAQSQSLDTVAARQAGQGQRLIGDITNNVAPRTDVYALDKALTEQRANEALPLRDKALFNEGQPVLAGPEADNAGVLRTLGVEETLPLAVRQSRIPEDATLQQLARLPFAQRALHASRKLAQEEVNLRSVLGQPIDDLPDVSAPGAQLDMRTLDYVKRYLDKEVNTLGRGADGNTFKAAEFAQVKQLRDALRDRMRQLVPEYGDYLDAYRTSSSMKDSLEAGRNYGNLDAEQIAAEQAARSPAEQELYRVGAARDMVDTVNATADNRVPADRLVNSPESRAAVEALGLPETNFQRFINAVTKERNLSALTREAGGNVSAARSTAAADADAGIHARLPFNPGSPFGWLGAAGRAITDRVSATRNKAVNEELLPMMLESDPAALNTIIENMYATAQKQNELTINRRRAARALSGVLGSILGTDMSANRE